MGKVLSVLFALLFAIVVLVADEFELIDLHKIFTKEEAYTPPRQIGYIWRTTPGNGESVTERVLGSITQYHFFEISASGEWSNVGSLNCGFMRCW